MKLGKVVGTVVSTSKNEHLIGTKLLILKYLDESMNLASDETEVAVDTVGAGVGEIVIVVKGSSAKSIFADNPNMPADAAIVGIVDTVETNG